MNRSTGQRGNAATSPPALPAGRQVHEPSLPDYSVSQVARLCGLHRETVVRHCREGKLAAWKTPGPKGRWRIPAAALAAYRRPAAADGHPPSAIRCQQTASRRRRDARYRRAVRRLQAQGVVEITDGGE